MLTSHDLAVIRAALMFANDELTPYGMDAWRPYVDEALNHAPTTDEVRQLRERLGQCELRYGVCDQSGTQIERGLRRTPVKSAPQARQANVPAVVLLLRDGA